MTSVAQQLRSVIEADQIPLPDAAQDMAAAIRARHGDAVRALVFYGSAMREAENPDKMLDFYVIVSSYKAVYPNPVIRAMTAALPPGVHFMKVTRPDGRVLRSKYAVVSERAFHHRVSGGSFETTLWARFVQPTVIIAEDDAVRDQLIDSFAKACRHFYHQAAPLIDDLSDPHTVWARGLAESYRTELRPEQHNKRAKEIVNRYPDRYAELSRILQTDAPAPSSTAQRICKARWWLRRATGKPRGAARVVKGALTFDAGLDYILEKVGSHSGVRIEVSDAARRHPILYAPVIAWRLYRAGAFR